MDLTGRSLKTNGICAVGYASDERSHLSDFFPPIPLTKAHVQKFEDLIYWQILKRAILLSLWPTKQ